MFALVDCNNFYASCERVFNPAIRHRPVIVLSNNDGCVIARSGEAKAIGFKMGDPYFKVRGLAARHGVAVFSSNYTLYDDMSRRVTVLAAGNTCPEAEIYSIDEAFLNLSGVLVGQLAARRRHPLHLCPAMDRHPGFRRHRGDQDAGEGRQSHRQEGPGLRRRPRHRDGGGPRRGPRRLAHRRGLGHRLAMGRQLSGPKPTVTLVANSRRASPSQSLGRIGPPAKETPRLSDVQPGSPPVSTLTLVANSLAPTSRSRAKTGNSFAGVPSLPNLRPVGGQRQFATSVNSRVTRGHLETRRENYSANLGLLRV